jgi:hypothetical protein
MRIVGLALASATSLLVLACVSSSSNDVVIGTRDNEEVFGTADGGDASLSPDVAASTLMCPSNQCPAGKVTCANNPLPCAVDLSSDNENCGACGVLCPTDLDSMLGDFHGAMRCVEGACRLSCVSGFHDCNGRPEDGCEIDLRESKDPNNCGVCGNVCEDGICSGGYCGCSEGMALCDGKCATILSDNNNCGECGNVCPPAPRFPANLRMLETCAGGQCNVRKCRIEWMDCNGDMAEGVGGDGCETSMLDPNNCFGCGNVCAPGEQCNLILADCVCPCGAVCDTPERVLSDPDNCGACGSACPGDRRSLDGRGLDLAHGRPVCDDGVCGYTCTPEWGNCDGDIVNGCEASFLSDPLNCGGCGIRCNGVEGQACVDGRCLTEDCGVIR